MAVLTGNGTVLVKVHSDKFTETRRVIVSQRFGITKCLQDRIGGKNLLL